MRYAISLKTHEKHILILFRSHKMNKNRNEMATISLKMHNNIFFQKSNDYDSLKYF